MFSPQTDNNRSSRNFPILGGRKNSHNTKFEYTSLDDKFPYNIEKIFRKHAEQQDKRQALSLALLHRRRVKENQKYVPELPENKLK
jgi:hypothetical protein